MKLILVNAPTPGYELQPYPPLQLGYLAAVLGQTGRHAVEILDMGVQQVPDDVVLRKIAGSDVVGVYFVTMNCAVGLHLCGLAKDQGLTTLAGGPHAALNPDQVLQSGVVDYVFVGEAEDSLVELMDVLERGDVPDRVAGLVFKRNAAPHRTAHRRLKPNLATLPWPARELIPMADYRRKTDNTSILASRGCPYACKFCSVSVMTERRYRKRIPAQVIDELVHVTREYGFERVTFFDDTFTLDRDYVMALCNELRARSVRTAWSCETRVDLLDQELLRAMKEAGCYRIFLGVESGSQRILDHLSKGITVEQIRTAVQLTRKSGISPFLSVMLGVPQDDEASIRDSISLVKSLEVRDVWFQPFAPFPGTDIVEDIRDLLGDDWPGLYQRLDLRSPVLPTRYLSLQEVRSLYLEAILSVAGPKALT